MAVAGLTVTEAREALLDRAGDFVVRPSLAVSVVAYAPRRFIVLGEVKASGA